MKQIHFDSYLSHSYRLRVNKLEEEEIIDGELLSIEGEKCVPISDGIPRFVEKSNYADNFGLQWNEFRSTQLDSQNGKPLSFNRFWNNTKWKPGDLYGKTILEAGSGAGRFTEILLDAGARVISFDYSNAVDANWRNNRGKGDLFLFQGDIIDLPLKGEQFDYVFCYGVLQHIPNPDEAYRILFGKLQSRGKISIDYYLKTRKLSPYNQPKYFWRRWSTDMDPKKLLRIIRAYMPYWLPIDTIIRMIPKVGPWIVALLHVPCWNYIRQGFSYRERLEWAIMDTFDALGAKYDIPKTIEEVESMVESTENAELEVFYGSNGVVANVIKL